MVELLCANNITLVGNRLKKTGGQNGAWDACALVETGTGDFEISFRLIQGSTMFLLGMIHSTHNPQQANPQDSSKVFVVACEDILAANQTLAIKYACSPTPTMSVRVQGNPWSMVNIPPDDYRPCVLLCDLSTELEIMELVPQGGCFRQVCHPILEKMWFQRDFTDCSIASCNQTIACHRNVLAAASPVWRAALQGGFAEAQTATLRIDDFEPQTVETVLKYLYTDDLNNADFSAVLPFALKYDLPNLAKRCGANLLQNVTPENVERSCVLSDFREHECVAPIWPRFVDAVQGDRALVEAIIETAAKSQKSTAFKDTSSVEIEAGGTPTAMEFNPVHGEIDDDGMLGSFEIVPKTDKCFLKHALLPIAPSEYKAAQSFKVGDKVLSSTGAELDITWVRKHAHALCQLVTLRTAQAELTVTFDHRIVVPGNGASSSERFAQDLKVGDYVFCGSRPQRLTKVLQFEQKTEVIELCFKPDEPVEARSTPRWGILAKGERPPKVESFGPLGPCHALPSPMQDQIPKRARSADP